MSTTNTYPQLGRASEPAPTSKEKIYNYDHAKLLPQAWDTLSLSERFGEVMERYVESDPNHNSTHAGLYAAFTTLLFRNGYPGSEDGEVLESQHDFSCNLEEWRKCVDEFKALDGLRQDLSEGSLQVSHREAAVFMMVLSIYKLAVDIAADDPGSEQRAIGGMIYLDKLRKSMLIEEPNGSLDYDEELVSDAVDPPDSDDGEETAQDGEVHENIEANKVHDLARPAFEKALRHKFLFGNLEKPELPDDLEGKGYVRPQIITTTDKVPPSLRIKDGRTLLDDPERSIATSVPAAPADDAFADPDGHSVWMTKAATRAKYFANEGWPKPVPKLPNKVVVRPTDDGAGMGVFATRDIKRFEPVLVERPYLVYSKASSIELSPKAFEELSEDQIVQITLNQVERYYQIVVDQQMIGEAREGFMSLPNLHKNDGSGPVFGIVRTNGWEISFGEVISGVDEDFGNGYGAIARVGSRFNHSCIPDVSSPGFDPATFTIRFTALRDIKAGSQIYASYTSIRRTKAERQKALAPYGFECSCRACMNATPQTDKLRQVSKALAQKWRSQAINVWSRDPKLTEEVLVPVLEMKRRMEEEGLDVESAGYFTFQEIIHRVYKQVGNIAKADELSREMLLTATGLLGAF